MRGLTRAGLLALGTGLLIGWPAVASEFVLNAVSYTDAPKANEIAIEMYNDSPQNLALKSDFESELKSAGYTISDSARLILSFETRDTSGSWTGGGDNRLIELRNSDNHTGTDAPAVRVSIFDSEKGGVLNQKRSFGVTEVSPSEFRIDAVLEDRSNGVRLWESWATTDIGASDDLSLRRAMVPPIVDHLGKTVRDRTFQAP